MARIVGVNIPDNKRIEYALTFVYGIGFSSANKVLKQAKVEKDKLVKDLAEEELKKIQNIIEANYKTEGDLKEEVRSNIKRLKEIGTYRGIRHIKNLPTRGQRTKSNARTKRGKRITIGALKKQDRVKLQRQQVKEEEK